MMEVLRFIFQGFWHWLGAFLMLAVVVNGIVEIIKFVLSLPIKMKDEYCKGCKVKDWKG